MAKHAVERVASTTFAVTIGDDKAQQISEELTDTVTHLAMAEMHSVAAGAAAVA